MDFEEGKNKKGKSNYRRISHTFLIRIQNDQNNSSTETHIMDFASPKQHVAVITWLPLAVED